MMHILMLANFSSLQKLAEVVSNFCFCEKCPQGLPQAKAKSAVEKVLCRSKLAYRSW